MKNRLRRSMFGKPERVSNIHRYFLACEFKPHGELWSIFDGFAYDIKPAFIHGKLGILCYEPSAAYGIVEINDEEEPLLGYLFTMTEPNSLQLLNKIKGYNGPDAYNCHNKILAHVYTDKNKVVTAWTYVLSSYVLEAYQQIEQVEFGMWQEDEAQLALLDKITKPDL